MTDSSTLADNYSRNVFTSACGSERHSEIVMTNRLDKYCRNQDWPAVFRSWHAVPVADRKSRRQVWTGLNLFVSSIAILTSTLVSIANAQNGDSDFLLFISGEYVDRQRVSDDTFSGSNFTPAADLLYTYSNGPWRVLGEYFLTDDENELERLQLGYDLSEDTTAWLGRFHQPISAWNSKYHHGAYLQPSITRPAIENWEDENGVLPAHLSGAMLESGVRRAGGDGIHYAVGVGLGPALLDSELHPYDLADPDTADGSLGASFAVSYYPDYVGSPNFGLLGGYTDIVVLPSTTSIPGNATTFNIEQFVIGAQADWQNKSWQLIAAAYYVDNQPDQGFAQYGGSFLSVYAQVLKDLNESVGIYLRLEGGRDTETAGYLTLFPQFISQRAQIGGRFDFATRQALAIEVSAVETAQDDFTEVRLQWSGVFQ